MSTTSQTVAESVAREAGQKRRRIASSLWPRARLIFEILYRQVESDRVFSQASALTYKTLFSLLPIFVLSLLVLSTISAGEGQNALDSAVKNMLFQQMGVDKFTLQDDTGHDITSSDGTKMTFAKFIEHYVDRAKSSISGKATGLVAFGILLYGSISLMIVIEGTFNQIFGWARPRSWPRRIMLYWCVLTLGPIGVAASIGLGNSALSAADSVASTHQAATALLSMGRFASGFTVSWVLILLLYKLIPDTHVRWRPAIIGAFVAALCWEVGKWAFGLYVQRAAKNSWYGSLALLPLFMFWIYITWSVVLIGLELTYVQQFWPLLKRRFFFTRAGGAGTTIVSDLRWVLALGALLYNQFKSGKATHVDEAAEILMLPNDVTGMLLAGLESAGIVHEARSGAYTLARPPENITAHDLLVAARSLCQVPPELAREAPHVRTYPTSPAMKDLEELENAWAKTHTLPSLAGKVETDPFKS